MLDRLVEINSEIDEMYEKQRKIGTNCKTTIMLYRVLEKLGDAVEYLTKINHGSGK